MLRDASQKWLLILARSSAAWASWTASVLAQLPRYQAEHLAVQTHQAVQPDILAIQGAAGLVPLRLVMDGRVVHEGLVFRRQLGAEIEAISHRRGAELQNAVAIAVPRPADPGVVGGQHRIGEFQQTSVLAALIYLPCHIGNYGSLRSIDPGIIAGHDAGQVALGRRRRQQRRQAFPRLIGIEQRDQQRVDSGIVQPESEAAELFQVPVAGAGDVGAMIDAVPNGVPAHDVAHRGAGLIQRRAGRRRRQALGLVHREIEFDRRSPPRNCWRALPRD